MIIKHVVTDYEVKLCKGPYAAATFWCRGGYDEDNNRFYDGNYFHLLDLKWVPVDSINDRSYIPMSHIVNIVVKEHKYLVTVEIIRHWFSADEYKITREPYIDPAEASDASK